MICPEARTFASSSPVAGTASEPFLSRVMTSKGSSPATGVLWAPKVVSIIGLDSFRVITMVVFVKKMESAKPSPTTTTEASIQIVRFFSGNLRFFSVPNEGTLGGGGGGIAGLGSRTSRGRRSGVISTRRIERRSFGTMSCRGVFSSIAIVRQYTRYPAIRQLYGGHSCAQTMLQCRERSQMVFPERSL